MKLALSEDQRRAVAAGLLMIPVLLVVWLGVQLVSARSEHHDRVTRLLLERDNDRALLKRAPAWAQQRDALRAASATTPLFFDAAEPASGTAHMQTEVMNAIIQDHITVLRNEVELVAENERKRTTLRMVLSFNADIATVTHVLFHLRNAHPLLFVQKLDLRASPQSTGTPFTGPNILQAEVTIIGFVQAS